MIEALTIKGSFRGISGHDHHVREFVRGLSQQGIQIELIDFADWAPGKLPAAKREAWFDNLTHSVDSKIALHFCMPQQVQCFKDKRNVNFTMFEADRILKKWVRANAEHDLVILPTPSSQQAWVKSGFPAENVRLCPLGVDTERFCPDAKPIPLNDQNEKSVHEYRVRFLNVSDLTPRKNLLALARVWIMAMHRHDDAVLILKLSSSEERLSEFMRNLEALESRLGKSRNDAAPILFLVNRFFSDAEMPGLFAAATHYWSMSHGEGWDLPMMEACATGLQVIAPNHSAYMAYLDDSVARMIPAKTTPVKFKMRDGTHKLFRGAKWWEPDETIAAQYIRQAIDNPVHGRNPGLRTRIAQNYTWKRATACLIDILSELEFLSQQKRLRRKHFLNYNW